VDEALAKSHRFFQLSPGDSFAKSQAFDRLEKSDPIVNFGRMVAHYRRQWAAEDRLGSLVKAEQSRQEAKRLKKRGDEDASQGR
jgi:hypothetical protein